MSTLHGKAMTRRAARACGRRPLLLLISLVLLTHLAVNLAWLARDHSSLLRVEDQASHFSALLGLAEGLETQGPREGAAALLRGLSIRYPVVSFAPQVLAGLVLGPSHTAFCLGNLLYLALLLWGTFALGELLHGRSAGLLAAALASLLPGVYGGSRYLGLDFNALCLTPAALVFLLRSDGFLRLGGSALAGLFAGLAVLAKPTALLFVLGPALAQLARGLLASRREGGGRAARPLMGAALAAGVVAGVTALWWAGRLESLGGDLALHTRPWGSAMAGVLPLAGTAAWYLAWLPLLLSGPLLVLVLLLLPRFLAHSRFSAEVASWLLLPSLLLVVAFSGRAGRYLLPLLPAAALVISVGLVSLGRGGVQAGVAVAALAAGLWLCCSFASWPPLTACQQGPSVHPPGQFEGPRPRPGSAPWWEALLSCGACQLAGPPQPRARSSDGGFHQLQPLTRELARWLEARHPGGNGALVRLDGQIAGVDDFTALGRTVALLDALVQVQRRLPGLRFSLARTPGTCPLAAPSPAGRSTYLLTLQGAEAAWTCPAPASLMALSPVLKPGASAEQLAPLLYRVGP